MTHFFGSLWALHLHSRIRRLLPCRFKLIDRWSKWGACDVTPKGCDFNKRRFSNNDANHANPQGWSIFHGRLLPDFRLNKWGLILCPTCRTSLRPMKWGPSTILPNETVGYRSIDIDSCLSFFFFVGRVVCGGEGGGLGLQKTRVDFGVFEVTKVRLKSFRVTASEATKSGASFCRCLTSRMVWEMWWI